MEPFSLHELRFLRRVPPFEYDCTTIIKEFSNYTAEDWEFVQDIIKTYGNPTFIQGCNFRRERPWDLDDFGVIERRYNEKGGQFEFAFFHTILHLVDNFNIVKQYRELPDGEPPNNNTIILNVHWKQKIDIAETFLRYK